MKLELLGILFIALAIFGSGASAISEGAIPMGLENIFRFTFGIWYFVASVVFLLTGIVLLLRRKYPAFLHRKLIGFYILFMGVLLLTHIQTFESLLLVSQETSILKSTWHHFIAYKNGQGTATQLGGGMVGGILFTFSYYLFSSIGAKIIAVFSILIGLIFMTEISISDIYVTLKKQTGKIWTKLKEFISQKREKENQASEVAPEAVTTKEIEEVVVEEELPDIAYSFDMQTEEKENKAESLHETGQKEENIAEAEEMDNITITTHSSIDQNEDYELPSPDLLADPIYSSQKHEKSQIKATVRTLEKTFHSFGVQAKVTKVHVGPAVTKYEIYPEAGVKVSRIVNLHDDLALALAAEDIRIEAPIPGKSAVGIEVPNKEIAMVSLREVLDVTQKETSKLLFALGRDISGDAVVGELNKMPHLLIAGATGSGKSVCINSIITTILMRAKPHEVKMMMIDPKKVELNVYNGIPHLLAPVVTDPKKAAQALKKVVAEMERRYELFSETGTRNIESYNDLVTKHNQAGENESEDQPHLPYIVVLVDELADLMMVASKDVEDAITRLAQMARAAGIHLIIATQRPSVDVITGVIKANIPSRIAFSVSSQVDSRTILDTGGAEKLLGRGDMLYIPVGSSKPIRVQGAFLSDEEVERVINHCITQQKASYQEEMIPETPSKSQEEVEDELFDEAVQLILNMQTASVSMLQRRFRIGYNRAARLIDEMEQRGIVGPHEGSKPREVLISNPSEEKSS